MPYTVWDYNGSTWTARTTNGRPVWAVGEKLVGDGNSLEAETVTESPGAAAVYGVTYGGGTRFDFHALHNTVAKMGGLFQVIKNYGVGGSTIQNIIDRWAVPATAPRLAGADTLHFGPLIINSFNPTLTSFTQKQILDQYSQLIAMASAGFKLVIVSSEWPVAVGWSGYARISNLATLVRKCAAICARYPNVIYVDTFKQLQDPNNANGDVKSGYVRVDNIHPTVSLGKAQGKLAAENLLPQIVVIPTAWPNLSPGWTGTAGTRNANASTGLTTLVGGSANVPTGWDASVVAGPTDPTGITVIVTWNEAQKRFHGEIANASATAIQFKLKMVLAASVHAAVPTGSKVFGRCYIGVSNMIACKAPDLRFERAGTATSPISARLPTNYASDQISDGDHPRTADYAPAAGLTDLRLAIVLEVGPGGTILFDIGGEVDDAPMIGLITE